MPARATAQGILVLHGITMNGSSMLRTLGPLGEALQSAGFDLIAPDGGRSMTRAEADDFVDSIAGAYEQKGLDARDWFTEGRFWDGEHHHDWLDPVTDQATGRKTYRAFDASIAAVEAATRDHDVVGILGFSQGCLWGSIVTALALRGELAFGDELRFGIYMSGFLPEFDEPSRETWPVPGRFESRFVIGDRDPMFPDGEGTIGPLAQQFPAEGRQVIIAQGLHHDVSDDPELVDQLARFAQSRV